MLRIFLLPVAVLLMAAAAADAVSPIYGVAIPPGYRLWRLVGVAQETGTLDELRAVLGNETAMRAYAAGTLPFPDGTVLVKLAWKHVQSTESPPAFIPGAPTTVHVMVKILGATWRAAAGGSGGSSTGSRRMRRSIRPASPATHPAFGIMTMSSRVKHRDIGGLLSPTAG